MKNKEVLNELHLFAGAGGGILAGQLLGHRTVCAVEFEPYAQAVLVARQNDGSLPPFPIWDDVRTFDGKPWCRIVDVVAGGFPCQDISAAGKGAGIGGERSGLWSEMARIIGEVQPRYAFIENSPMLVSRGLDRVLSDLAKMGFDAEWGVVSAADVGANHRRDRIWILAKRREQLSYAQHNGARWRKQQQESIKEAHTSGYTKRELANTNLCRCDDGQIEINTTEAGANAQCKFGAGCADVANTEIMHSNGSTFYREYSESKVPKLRNCSSQKIRNPNISDVERQWQITIRAKSQLRDISNASWWIAEPDVGRVANGVDFRVDRLKAIGNGQVPLCAATAWQILSGEQV